MAKKHHDHRSVDDETGHATCECGDEFENDIAWMAHWDELGTPIEEIHARGREPDPVPEMTLGLAEPDDT